LTNWCTCPRPELAAELGDRGFEQLRTLLVRLNDIELVRGSAGAD
jgi:hypothetical protein